MSIAEQVFVGIVSAIILVLLCIYRNNVKYQQIANQDRSNPKIALLDGTIFFVAFVCGMLLINVIFSVCKKNDWYIVSNLTYGESQSMLISAIIAFVIAFFQYRIQMAFDVQSYKDSQLKEIFHKAEVKSSQIQTIDVFNRIKAFGINFNIPYSKSANFKYYKNFLADDVVPCLLVRICPKDDEQLIFPQHIKIRECTKVSIFSVTKESKLSYPKKMFGYKCYDDKIDIIFYEDINNCFLNNFLLSPLLENEFDRQKLIFEISYSAEDTSYIDFTDGNSKNDKKINDYREIKFKLKLTLIPDGGYKKDGKFNIRFISQNIENNWIEDNNTNNNNNNKTRSN